MESIGLKSEKTRNIIGKVPPAIIRFGNIFILFFLIVLFFLSMSIRIPKIQYGEIIVSKGGKQIDLYLKEINHNITRGNKMKVYKNGLLLYQTTIPHTVEHLYIKDDYFWTPLDIEFFSFSNQGMLFEVDNNTLLTVEIETKRENFIQYLNLL